MVIAELGRTRLYRFPGYVRWLQQKSEMTRMIAIEPRTPFRNRTSNTFCPVRIFHGEL